MKLEKFRIYMNRINQGNPFKQGDPNYYVMIEDIQPCLMGEGDWVKFTGGKTMRDVNFDLAFCLPTKVPDHVIFDKVMDVNTHAVNGTPFCVKEVPKVVKDVEVHP